ncbi:MAG: hypothetical protein Q8R18_00980 [bacterium]|nr:hypothetical protein [bacterium]
MQRQILEEVVEDLPIDCYDLETLVLYTPPPRTSGPIVCGSCGGLKNSTESFIGSSLSSFRSRQNTEPLVRFEYRETPMRITPYVSPEPVFELPEVKPYEAPTYRAQDFGLANPLEQFRALHYKPPEAICETPRYAQPHPEYFSPEIKPFELSKPAFEIKPYEPPKIDRAGLLSAEDFQFGYALDNGVKVSFHGISETRLTHSHVKIQGNRDPLKEFDGYESALLDVVLKNNFKRFT